MTDFNAQARAALANYHGLVEANDQAIPILTLTDTDGQLYVFGLQGIEQAHMAPALETVHHEMRSSGMPTMAQVTIMYEAWLRYLKPDGSEDAVDETVLCTSASADETVLLTQTFVRTKDGVRWEEPNEVPVKDVEGDLIPALRKFVTVPA